jgi:hypothetical protein
LTADFVYVPALGDGFLWVETATLGPPDAGPESSVDLWRIPTAGGPVQSVASVAGGAPLRVEGALGVEVRPVQFAGGDVVFSTYGEIYLVRGGVGAPTLIATDTQGVWSLALDDEWIWWNSNPLCFACVKSPPSNVRRVPRAGGDPADVWSSDSGIGFIATYGGSAYVDGAGIVRIAADGTATTLVADTGQVDGLAVDSSGVYFTLYESNDLLRTPL